MRYFKTEIEKILTDHKSGKIDTEEAVRKAILSFEKEVDNPMQEDIGVRKEAFRTRMLPFVDKYPADMLRKFFDHWTGFQSERSFKMLFEKQKVFQMGARLATWAQNAQRFARNSSRAAVTKKGPYGK